MRKYIPLLLIVLLVSLALACGSSAPEPTAEPDSAVYETEMPEEASGWDWTDSGQTYSTTGLKIHYSTWGPSAAYGCIEVTYNDDYELMGCGDDVIVVELGGKTMYFDTDGSGGIRKYVKK